MGMSWGGGIPKNKKYKKYKRKKTKKEWARWLADHAVVVA
jgi:hypothetical protein